jgi:Vitamin K-dependent gamma-carboxylase
VTRAYEAWERFWFAPQPTSTLALVRIAFGLMALAWTASLGPDLAAFFGPHGLVPVPSAFSATSWGILQIASPMWLVGLVWALTLVASFGLIVGYRSRLCSFVVLIGVLSFERRNPYVFNGGDGLVRVLALYLLLSPSGAALSLDRLRSGGSFWSYPQRAPWGLRFMQLQISLIYLSALWEKFQGDSWPGGTALSYALRLDDLSRFPLPGFMTDVPAVVAMLTWMTLAIEFSAGVLIWIPKLRPWVIVAGVTLHLMIAWSIRVGFFSAGMLILYLSFMSPERAAWVVETVRRRAWTIGRDAVQKIPRRRRRLV